LQRGYLLQRDIRRAKDAVGAEGVDEAAVLPGDVDNKRLAGVGVRRDF